MKRRGVELSFQKNLMSQTQELDIPANQMAHPDIAALCDQLDLSLKSSESTEIADTVDAATSTTSDLEYRIKHLVDYTKAQWHNSIVATHIAVRDLDYFILSNPNVVDAYELINTVVRTQIKVSLMHRVHRVVLEEVKMLEDVIKANDMETAQQEFSRVEATAYASLNSVEYRVEPAFIAATRTRNFLTQIYRSRIGNIHNIHPQCSCCPSY